MRFHVVGLPQTYVTDDFSPARRMMHERGHEVFLYAGEQNDAPCAEHITCILDGREKVRP